MVTRYAETLVKPHACRSQLSDAFAESREALGQNHIKRDEQICRLFGAQCIEPRSPIMRYGWERPNDEAICDIIIYLLQRSDRLSLIELGSGTTWGSDDREFGVAGLSRILKHALPNRLHITVTDRQVGYDLFIRDSHGRLMRSEFKDDRPPRGIPLSPLDARQIFIPTRGEDIVRSRKVDPEFSAALEHLSNTYDFELEDPRNAVFIRPRIDPEIEALMYGIRALSGVNYLSLIEDLQRHEQFLRFDFIFARHLCPVLYPSRVQHLKDTLPQALESCARHGYVQFDRIAGPDGNIADLIFQHHEYIR